MADLDGVGHVEMLVISNGADPHSGGWGCDVAPWSQPDPANPTFHECREDNNEAVPTSALWVD